MLFYLNLNLNLQNVSLRNKINTNMWRLTKWQVVYDSMLYLGRPLQRHWAHRLRKSHPWILQCKKRQYTYNVLLLALSWYIQITLHKKTCLDDIPGHKCAILLACYRHQILIPTQTVSYKLFYDYMEFDSVFVSPWHTLMSALHNTYVSLYLIAAHVWLMIWLEKSTWTRNGTMDIS